MIRGAFYFVVSVDFIDLFSVDFKSYITSGIFSIHIFTRLTIHSQHSHWSDLTTVSFFLWGYFIIEVFNYLLKTLEAFRIAILYLEIICVYLLLKMIVRVIKTSGCLLMYLLWRTSFKTSVIYRFWNLLKIKLYYMYYKNPVKFWITYMIYF